MANTGTSLAVITYCYGGSYAVAEQWLLFSFTGVDNIGDIDYWTARRHITLRYCWRSRPLPQSKKMFGKYFVVWLAAAERQRCYTPLESVSWIKEVIGGISIWLLTARHCRYHWRLTQHTIQQAATKPLVLPVGNVAIINILRSATAIVGKTSHRHNMVATTRRHNAIGGTLLSTLSRCVGYHICRVILLITAIVAPIRCWRLPPLLEATSWRQHQYQPATLSVTIAYTSITFATKMNVGY